MDVTEQAGPVLWVTVPATLTRRAQHLTDDGDSHLWDQKGGTNFVEGPDMVGRHRMHVVARAVDMDLAGPASATGMGILEVYE